MSEPVPDKKERFVSTGFSPRRLAFITTSLVLCLLPVHFVVPCEASGAVLAGSLLLFALTCVFCLCDRAPGRFTLLAIAAVGVVLHGLCVH